MLVSDVFEKDVSRDINPVVYFHEQSPQKVAEEVGEYIITGGYEGNDPRKNEHGIHEQFVRLLTGIAGELEKPAGPEQPAAWISGFYGSGKSSFAKLLGLSFGDLKLPDGTPLSESLLKKDDSPRAPEFRAAWERVLAKGNTMAVVFDIGSVARDEEHIHAAIVRQCQVQMGYCSTSSLVADHELKLEADGHFPAFQDQVKQLFGKPWSEIKDKQLAEDHFSATLHALQPDLYGDKMAWIDANAGRKTSRSAEEAVAAIDHMLSTRFGSRRLFLVVDEVSQYVHDNADRMLKLQSLVVALGQRLKGKVWLLATGQQKLEEGASATANLSKMKDRFPAHLRVHLGSNNIRDVVHQRLLKKRATVREQLEELFSEHRAKLSLYGYKCDQVGLRDLVDVYPMLPGHIDLLMEITTGLRERSSRVQGDSHAIRGLLQMLGDIFRDSDLGRHEVGALITLDRIYDVLHTALDADVQTTLTRAFEYCDSNPHGHLNDAELARKTLKAVSLLELISDERLKRDAELIARTLYERLGDDSRAAAIQKGLDVLAAAGFVEASDKTGYKIQSSAGQEWQKERDNFAVGADRIGAKVLETLTFAMGDVEKAQREGMALPWQAWLSNSIGVVDAHVKNERSTTKIEVDFRLLPKPEAQRAEWVTKSGSGVLQNRIIWVVGDVDGPREAATKLARSERMIERYGGTEASLTAEKRRFLTEERNRHDDAQKELKNAVERAFVEGCLYFRGKDYEAREHGVSLATVLADIGARAAKQLYPNPITFRVSEAELKFLIESPDLAAPPPVFGEQKLGILTQDAGRFEASCTGAMPSEILRIIEAEPGLSGGSLLSHFGGPPHGYSPDLVRACLLGLLRGHKLRVRMPAVGELTSARDEGARELLKENTLRKSEFFPNQDETISARDRNAMCTFFKDNFEVQVSRDDDEIAVAVSKNFATAREWLSQVEASLARLPNKPAPQQLAQLAKALEACRRDRKVQPTVKALKRSLPQLRDGLAEVRRLLTDLSDEAVSSVRVARDFVDLYLEQLEDEAKHGAVDASQVQGPAAELRELLGSPRPWEAARGLDEAVAALKALYIARRKDVLTAHQRKIEETLASLKLRDGFDTLSQDDQHRVLQHVREGGSFDTKVDVPAPPLSELVALSPRRLGAALDKALAQLDELREVAGAKPTVTVSLAVAGREFETEAGVERFLSELREQLLSEIRAGRRVRLK